MPNSVIIAPTYLRSSDAVGQIERHFFPNLPTEYYSYIISARYDLSVVSTNCSVSAIEENHLLSKMDLIFRKYGLTDLVFSPDIFHYSWAPKAYKEASRLIQRGTIDYVHTINNPVSSHLLGYKLKQRFGIPWVAQFYDPWHNNPFRKYNCTSFERKDKRNEQLVAENADLLLFPNLELLNSWIQMYGAEVTTKSSILPFVTEISKYEEKSKNEGSLVISHIGTLSEKRRAEVFIRAMAKLKRDYPSVSSKIKVYFVGYISDTDEALIHKEGLTNQMTVIGHISEEECRRYYELSDLFLIIDIDCDPNLFYPSKLLKYFCYKKPIIGLTKNQSVVANELNKTKNFVFDYEDVKGVASFLYQAASDYESVDRNDKFYYKTFLAENVVPSYNRLIKGLLNR